MIVFLPWRNSVMRWLNCFDCISTSDGIDPSMLPFGPWQAHQPIKY